MAAFCFWLLGYSLQCHGTVMLTERGGITVKPQQLYRFRQLAYVIRQSPGRRPGFFARLLGWRREEVNRALAHLDEEGVLLFEDDKGGLWPFDPDAVPENS
jgi:hypothetical protein